MFFSKKKKNTVNDDFDMDSDLDFDDFDFPDPDVKDDRKPVVKIGDGIVQGAVGKVKDTAFLKKTLADSLPSSYGETMDLASNVKDTVRDIYDESAKEIKPAIKEGKKLIGKLIPKESKLVPKAVYETIDRWKQEELDEKKSAVLSKEAQQEAMLSSQLADIFKVQTEMAVEQTAKEEGKERLQEGIAFTRHNELADLVKHAAVSLDKMEKYESSITLGYQKKSLELQFRQLFAAQDILQFAKEDAVKRDNVLLAISKNTALPEAVKIKSTEISALVAKNKFSETVYRSLFGGRDNVVEDILTNVRKRAVDQVKGFTGALRMGMDAADQVKDQGDQFGMDAYVEGGKMAGGMVVGNAGEKLANWGKDSLEAGKLGKAGQWILDKGKKLDYLHQNKAQKINTVRNKDHDDGTLFGKAKNILAKFLPNMSPDLNVDVQDSKNIGAQQVYTRRTEKSITEIIPGYLSRILREIQVLRTGNEKIELTQYDLDKNKFTSKSKLDSKLLKSVVDANSAKYTNYSLDSLVKRIDPTEKALSEDAKRALKKQLLINSSKNREGNEEYLANARYYGEMDPKHRKEVLPLMQKFFEGMSDDDRIGFTDSYNYLTQGISDPRKIIQDQINLGNVSELKKLGLVDKNNRLDTSRYFDYLLDHKPEKPATSQSKKPKLQEPNDERAGPEFVGPMPPRSFRRTPQGPTLKERANSTWKNFTQSWQQHTTPQAMQGYGELIRQKATAAKAAVTEQIDNPESTTNNAIQAASNKAENLRTSIVRGTVKVKSAARRAKDYINNPESRQETTESIKNISAPLSAFFNGLRGEAPSSQEEQEEKPQTNEQLKNVGPLGILGDMRRFLTGLKRKTPKEVAPENKIKIPKQNTTTIPTNTLKSQPVKKKKIKQKKNKNRTNEIYSPKLNTISQAIQQRIGEIRAVPKSQTIEVVETPAITEETKPKASPIRLFTRRVSDVFNQAQSALSDPKKLVQQIQDKAKEVLATADRATGGQTDEPVLDEKIAKEDNAATVIKKLGRRVRKKTNEIKESPKATELKEKAQGLLASINEATGGEEDDKSLDIPITKKDTAAKVIKKLDRKGRKKIQEIKTSEAIQDVKEKATRLKDRAEVKAKEAITKFNERSLEGHAKAAVAGINEIVDSVKSGEAKEKVLKAATEAKNKIINFDVMDAVHKVLPSKDVITDVFVTGEDQPRLTAIKIQAGHYLDTVTNKIIRNYRDIRGPVIDVANNGNTVIEQIDLSNLSRIDPVTKTRVKLDIIPGKVTLREALKTTVELVKNEAISTANMVMRDIAMDVYVEGEKEPRLTGIKLMRGEYFDKATGENIWHETEIKGAVVDKEGTTLIESAELPKLRIWIREQGRMGLIQFTKNVLGKLGKAAWYYQTKIAPAWVKWNFKMLRKAIAAPKQIYKALSNPVKDVYVGDEKVPRLYAARLKNGEYFDATNGDQLFHQDDIAGPVMDGDMKTVISDDDLQKLKIYDNILKVFNPIKLGTKALKYLYSLGKSIAKRTGKLLWKGYKKALSIGAKVGKKVFGSTFKAIGHLIKTARDVLVRGETTARLVGIVMKEGGYTSEKTGKIIHDPSDIDGPVLGPDGKVVLTEEHIKLGLVERDGRPIKSPLLADIIRGVGVVSKLFSVRRKFAVKKSGIVEKKLIDDPLAPAADKTVLILQDIKAFLENKLTPKKANASDSDGDGDRDNSAEDKRKKREEEKAKKKEGFVGPLLPEKKEDKKSGLLGMLLPAIGALVSKITGLTSMFGVVKTALSLIPGVGKIAGAVGTLAESGIGKTIIGAAGKGIGALARGGVGLAARALPMLGGLASSAASAASSIGASGALAGAGSTLAAVGGGILTFLSSPVVLGVAATAALGYGAYKAYGYFNDSSSSPLAVLRLVQYGFPKTAPKTYLSKIQMLEAYLKDFLIDGQSGPSIKEADLDIKTLMAPWGLDSTNEEHMALFFKWYQERFKPVYLTHIAAIKSVTQKTDLKEADSLKGEELKRYLDIAKFSDGPYHVTTLPLLDREFAATTSGDVRAAVEELIASLAKNKKNGVTEKQLKAPAYSPTVTTASGVAKLSAKPGESGLAPLAKLDDKMSSSSAAITSSVDATMFGGANRANALDAVRYKAYGLNELDKSKVKALTVLEAEVRKNVTYDSKSSASWKGNPIALLEDISGLFGIGELYGKESNDWAIWFTDRFLPVYMAHLSAIMAYTGKTDNGTISTTLSSEQQLQLAKLLIGLKGIWSVRESPWPNFALSSSSEVTKENINMLESVAKETKMQEDKKASSKTDDTKIASATELPKDALKQAKSPNDTLAYKNTSPDTEVKVSTSSTGIAPASVGLGSAGSVAIAGGEIVDGRNAQAFLSFGKDVNLSRMNPTLLKQFYGMVEEFGKLTGKKVSVNDGFRTYEDQVAMKQKYGDRAAAPGNSLHEFGLALDVDSATLNEMDKMGLMRKYGFTRPVGGEPWHLEPAGIQTDISTFKKNVDAANKAIEGGIGRGGGGLGTVANAPRYTRNRDLALKLLNAPAGRAIENRDSNGTMTAQSPNMGGEKKSLVSSVTSTVSGWFGSDKKPETAPAASVGGGTDGETKPTVFERVKSAFGFGSGSVPAVNNNLPADPSVKVPEAKGSGFSAVKDTIMAAAKMVGIDPDIMFKTAAVESGFNPSAKAGTSSAAGLFQFTKGTWDQTVTRHGAKYGYTPGNASPLDAKAASIMGAHYIKDSTQTLGKRLGRPVGATETYMAHFLGPAGAGKFLSELQKNPNAIAAQIIPQAAASNKDIFYDGGRARTLNEVYTLLDQRVINKAKSFGVPVGTGAALRQADNSAASKAFPSADTVDNTQTNSSPQSPLVQPKQDYSPRANESIAKPSIASTITNQNNSPLTDAFGFKPMQTAASLAPQGQDYGMGKDAFLKTENLLSQSVEIQKKMLEVMSNIFGIVSAKKEQVSQDTPTGDSTKPRFGDQYTVPKAPVSMGRSRLAT